MCMDFLKRSYEILPHCARARIIYLCVCIYNDCICTLWFCEEWIWASGFLVALLLHKIFVYVCSILFFLFVLVFILCCVYMCGGSLRSRFEITTQRTLYEILFEMCWGGYVDSCLRIYIYIYICTLDLVLTGHSQVSVMLAIEILHLAVQIDGILMDFSGLLDNTVNILLVYVRSDYIFSQIYRKNRHLLIGAFKQLFNDFKYKDSEVQCLNEAISDRRNLTII